MAQKPFHVPVPLPAPDAAEDPRDWLRKRALIGGDLDQRRAHGKPSGVQGRWVLDPVFRPADEATLRAHCDPTDPRPLVIEIGFQFGRFATPYCLLHPHVRFVGFEVRRKFCQDASARLEQFGVTNAWLALVDARALLSEVVAPASVAELFVFFPDPWWKRDQAKKRLLSAEFVSEAALLIRLGGRLLLKTDVPGYADWAEAVLRGEPAFDVRRLADPSAGLPPTLREGRCLRFGTPTFAIEARRRPCADTMPADLLPAA
ncbi:MAG: hypothetical protein EXR79_08495 [Myxococcales bacterium]|nr:hypothetical protein [Myxococcales bacterium]